MKKVLAILLVLLMIVPLVACGSKDSGTYEIAMITDIGEIDDKSFNQGTWEGVEAYAKANDKTYKYYKPTEQSTDAYLASIQQAIDNGAKVVVTPGYLFEEPIFKAQDLYPDVTFILIDGTPHNADYSEYKTGENAVGIVFAEQECGYLAGYAAVKDGYKKLGFMGGMAVPAVVRYGYGFVQGAEAAAKEMGLTDVEVKYYYTGNFENNPDNQTFAASWYSEGVEVIFACGGKVGLSVFAAAETAGAKSIGVDVDQYADSDTVITSAMKDLGGVTQKYLDLYFKGEFPGGQNFTLTAADEATACAIDNARFNTFTADDYKAIYDKVASGEVTIKDDTVGETPASLGVTTITLTYVQ